MQPIGEQDSDYVSIDKKLSLLSPSPSECCIFRVHDQLRRVNEKAYKPKIVAIGPYHHAKKGLQLMEEHKLRYLQSLLHRKNESSVERYRLAIKSLEQQARKCYAESISLTQDEMIDMMLLDGCFIIELILKYKKRNLRDKDDPIFQRSWMRSSLKRDLMLFENQLPLFILWKLIDMIVEVPNKYEFIELGFSFFGHLFPSVGGREHIERDSLYGSKHLLGLMYHRWVLSFVGTESKKIEPKKTTWPFIPSATELCEAGIKLEKVEGGTMLNIKFQNGVLHGVLQIPPLNFSDYTETFFKNLIAYKQYFRNNELCYIADYTTIMDSLIDSPKDVAILSRRGIIRNWNGDGEVVSKMFNKIRDEITMHRDPFLYADIFDKVNIRCQMPWSRRMAMLNRNYLNSPWALISVLAALVLLLLTSTQTYFAVFPRK